MPTKNAREIATRIREKQYGRGGLSQSNWGDDEAGIINEFKKLKSKGQVSQVASAYGNAPLNYGNLGNDVTDALTGSLDSDIYITQLTTYISSLPN
jgi:hypothetical protein